MTEKKYLYWMAVSESEPVRFSELAHMMAKAMHPSDAELDHYGATRLNLDDDLPRAVRDGELVVRNPAGMGKHTFPHGASLQSAVMLPTDLQPFLAERGIELRLTAHGSGPNYWTLENAAIALQSQEGWHGGTRAEFLDQLEEAAQRDELTVRDPRTCLPVKSPQARTFWELVTPADVNAWLENLAAPYRWNVVTSEEEPELKTAESIGPSNATEPQERPMKKVALVAALEHEWASIEADLSEATRNGLKEAAHAGKHGEWFQSKARAWAVSRNKIRQATLPIHPATWPGGVTRNRL